MSDEGVQVAPEISIAYIIEKCVTEFTVPFKRDDEPEMFECGRSCKADAKRTHDEGQGFEVAPVCGTYVGIDYQAT
jgi:hypothetical protein